MEPKTAAAVIIDKLGAMQLKAAGDEEFLEMVTDETWDMRNELGLRGDSNWAYDVEDAIRELLGIEHTLRGQALADFKQATANEGAIKLTRSALRSLIKEELSRVVEDPHGGGHTQGNGPTFTGAGPGAHPLRGFYDDDDPHGDAAEVDRGFTDGYDGVARADDATADYDIGYEQGQMHARSEQENQGPRR